jgi:transcriptional regulator with XRE-family HTH domain
MNDGFGSYVRKRREELLQSNRDYSVRKLAARIGVQPSYISKVEREEVAPPSEETIARLAEALGEDRDVLLALAGKVSADLRQAILKRPKLFADLIRQLRDAPDHALASVVREVRDATW